MHPPFGATPLMINRLPTVLTLALTLAVPGLCRGQTGEVRDSDRPQAAPAASTRLTPVQWGAVSDRDVFMNAARTAWTYVDRQYNRQTGLVNSVVNYRYATVWDIGSSLLALFSANQRGLLPDADYDARMRRAAGVWR